MRIVAVSVMVLVGILSFGVSVLFGWWAGNLMVNRGRTKEWGWIWGSLGGVVAVIVIACLSDRTPKKLEVAV